MHDCVRDTRIASTVRWVKRPTLLWLSIALISNQAQAQGVLQDSHATLTMRNYYLDRDYKDDGAKQAAREWAQGFILNVESGYSEGPVGFGLDTRGFLGIKLDSAPSRSGTELLPVSKSDGEAADDYSRLALTAKMRWRKSVVKSGDVSIFLPFAFASPSRLLPQTFRGTTLSSSDVDGLVLNTGYIDRINKRDSTSYERMGIASPNRRFNGAATSSHLAYAGADYQVTPALGVRLYHAELDDLYQQDTLAALYEQRLGPGTLTADLRSFFSREDGRGLAGEVDNRNLSALFSYRLGGHRLGIGYMHASGDTGTPYIGGTELMGMSELTMSSDFLNARERTWQAIYDYDFTAVGLVGLKGRLRYVRGDHIELAAFDADGRKEREMQMELGYVIQSGPLKNLGLLARKSIYRNDFPAGTAFRDENQTRFQLIYSLPIW
ncbi:OprD family porin [Pseudomonas sp. Hg5Tf]|uniref:OprD family porin n=1 Tax=Pseudomonas sp. Hg7Tf TaxID=3236988 RepID=A0AB39I6N5_9PSED|nr:OprD family porin [Pseudomonas sp. Hg5Tf]MDH2562016.1 OprD family porin [Pseudomonas sp. Hg5Tf]